MTAPIRPLVLSLDGRSARELYAIERTNDDGEPTNPPAGSGGVLIPDLKIAEGMTVMTAQPSGETTTYWPETPWYDSTGANQMRVVVGNVETAGHTTARIYAQQKGALGGTFAHPGIGVTEVAAPISATGPQKSNWIDLDATAIGERIWKAFAIGGNGTLTPVVGGIHFQFRQRAIARPPIGGPPIGDLPEDATWGNIVFDANAAHAAMVAAYSNGDDVNAFFDRIAANDLATAATLLLPKYRTTAFSGGKPCVEWAGANIPLSAPVNPTVGTGDYTYYFVIDGLDGGDAARIWGAGFGDSFQYSIYADSDTVYAANNNLFGSPSLFAEDSGGTAWGMSGKHIYRWTKFAGGSSHHLFVDGVLKASAGAAPQTNNAGAVDFMNDLGGLGMSGKIGRVVAYNKSHISPTNTGGMASGLTAPEQVLRTYWGTP